MHLYFKAIEAYAGAVFRPDEDEIRDPYTEGAIDPMKKNAIRRYIYYTMENFMIVDDAHGCYVECPMPKPWCIPGKIYWWGLYIWQTKIVKTHI